MDGRLKLYEKVRMGRAGAVQVFSRFGQDQADKVKQEVEKIEGWKGVVPGKEVESFFLVLFWCALSNAQLCVAFQNL